MRRRNNRHQKKQTNNVNNNVSSQSSNPQQRNGIRQILPRSSASSSSHLPSRQPPPASLVVGDSLKMKTVELIDPETSALVTGTLWDDSARLPFHENFIIVDRTAPKKEPISLPVPRSSKKSDDSSINDLTDDALVYLLKLFPLQIQFLYLRSVCKRWRRLLHGHFRSLKKLKFFGSIHSLNQHVHYHQSLGCLNTFPPLTIYGGHSLFGPDGGIQKSRVQYFIHNLQLLFPNVIELILYDPCFPDQSIVRLFAGKWRYNLELFGLFHDPSHEILGFNEYNFNWHHVFKSLSLLPKLAHLLLCDAWNDTKDSYIEPCYLTSVFSRLETLYLGFHETILFRMINMLGARIRRLVIFYSGIHRIRKSGQIIKIRKPVARNLRYLALESSVYDEDDAPPPVEFHMLKHVGESFRALNALDIATDVGIKFEHVLLNIRKLPHLHALRLRFGDSHPIADFLQFNLTLNQNNEELFPLPLITQFAVQNSMGSFANGGLTLFLIAFMPHVFPNLEYLHLINCPAYCRSTDARALEHRHSNLPCETCEKELLAAVLRNFARMRRFRRLRYRSRRVAVSRSLSANDRSDRVDAFEPVVDDYWLHEPDERDPLIELI